MHHIVSITSQGQVTIPKSVRKAFGIDRAAKAVLKKVETGFLIEPKKDFWSLPGSLSSSVRLSNADLRKAREEFSRTWGQK